MHQTFACMYGAEERRTGDGEGRQEIVWPQHGCMLLVVGTLHPMQRMRSKLKRESPKLSDSPHQMPGKGLTGWLQADARRHTNHNNSLAV